MAPNRPKTWDLRIIILSFVLSSNEKICDRCEHVERLFRIDYLRLVNSIIVWNLEYEKWEWGDDRSSLHFIHSLYLCLNNSFYRNVLSQQFNRRMSVCLLYVPMDLKQLNPNEFIQSVLFIKVFAIILSTFHTKYEINIYSNTFGGCKNHGRFRSLHLLWVMPIWE